MADSSVRQPEEQTRSDRRDRRAAHLTGVDAAREELVQLDQFVGGDVELERDAAEGVVRSHLSQEGSAI